jgi:hypothetical protein
VIAALSGTPVERLRRATAEAASVTRAR